MTDQNLTPDLHPEDVEHARAYVKDFLDATYAPDRTLAVARVLQALLPTPPRPTMAGMTPEERAECQWMQADTERGRAVIIIAEWVIDHAELLDRWGKTFSAAYDSITPRPDLPRMTFPGDQKPDSSLPEGWRLADHKDYGRVIVTTKNLVRDGYMGFIHRADPINAGHGSDWCKPDELTYIDTGDQARVARQALEAPSSNQWDLPMHRTEAGYPNCATCDGGGCFDCTDPA